MYLDIASQLDRKASSVSPLLANLCVTWHPSHPSVVAPQVLAVDLMYHHPAVAEVTLRTAAMLCLAPAYPPQLGVHAVEVSPSPSR